MKVSGVKGSLETFDSGEILAELITNFSFAGFSEEGLNLMLSVERTLVKVSCDVFLLKPLYKVSCTESMFFISASSLPTCHCVTGF